MPKGEVIITFSFLRREDCRFAKAGYEQGWDQFIIKAADKKSEATVEGKVDIKGTDTDFTVFGDNFNYTFSKGLLVSIEKDGKEYLVPAIESVIVDVKIDDETVIIRPLKGIFDDEN
jgi:hypothetical protein